MNAHLAHLCIASREHSARAHDACAPFGSSPPLTAPEPTPWIGNVTPFLVPSAEMLRSRGPNALKSGVYAKDFNEVKSLGRSRTRRAP